MSTKNYIYKKCGWLLPAVLFTLSVNMLTSCNEWLDVKGENTVKEENQFSSYKGFCDALTGCYMAMADEAVYGQRLTMTDIESMANLWTMDLITKETDNPQRFCLTNHLWTNDGALTPVQTIYNGLFNVIAQANVIIKHASENLDLNYNMKIILGEAYAIRAYCQFDVLRLFGQMPQGGGRQVSLPYSYTTNNKEMPQYYPYSDYVGRLESDIDNALNNLEGIDPITLYSLDDLNNASSTLLDDGYLYYRQMRLNYWAVKALQARLYLYTGNSTKAHDTAIEVINARQKDGQPVMVLSGSEDLPKNYYACPSECLFSLSKYNVKNTSSMLVGGEVGAHVQIISSYYTVSTSQLDQLYASIVDTKASHNRYNSLWNMNSKSPSGIVFPTIKKYWYSEDENESLLAKHQIIPMLRMSEMYLIALETARSVAEANLLYATYMRSCAVINPMTFESLDEVKSEMLNEYRREFFAEGQMFYTYKRTASKSMMWNNKSMTEDDYIVPLPQTEYNPN